MLNLSCNKIVHLSGLQRIAATLKVLNLSHNRVVALTHLSEIAPFAVLEVLDLTDNCVGDIGQLRCLSGLGFLIDIAF